MKTATLLRKSLWLIALAIAGLALVAAACGGGEEEAATPTPRATASPAASPRAASPAASPRAASPAVSPRPASPAAAAPVTSPIAIEQRDNFFVFPGQRNPNIVVKAGQEITVNIENKGQAIHNMRIAGLDDKYDTRDDTVSNPDTMKAGAKGSLKFKVDKAGGYKFRCDFHPDEMTGTFTVVQ